jgi:hypothetical protein
VPAKTLNRPRKEWPRLSHKKGEEHKYSYKGGRTPRPVVIDENHAKIGT